MKLIFVRHATAIERSAKIAEEERYLTSEGRVFFRKTARTMLKKGIEPGLILTSPSSGRYRQRKSLRKPSPTSARSLLPMNLLRALTSRRCKSF